MKKILHYNTTQLFNPQRAQNLNIQMDIDHITCCRVCEYPWGQSAIVMNVAGWNFRFSAVRHNVRRGVHWTGPTVGPPVSTRTLPTQQPHHRITVLVVAVGLPGNLHRHRHTALRTTTQWGLQHSGWIITGMHVNPIGRNQWMMTKKKKKNPPL